MGRGRQGRSSNTTRRMTRRLSPPSLANSTPAVVFFYIPFVCCFCSEFSLSLLLERISKEESGKEKRKRGSRDAFRAKYPIHTLHAFVKLVRVLHHRCDLHQQIVSSVRTATTHRSLLHCCLQLHANRHKNGRVSSSWFEHCFGLACPPPILHPRMYCFFCTFGAWGCLCKSRPPVTIHIASSVRRALGFPLVPPTHPPPSCSPLHCGGWP